MIHMKVCINFISTSSPLEQAHHSARGELGRGQVPNADGWGPGEPARRISADFSGWLYCFSGHHDVSKNNANMIWRSVLGWRNRGGARPGTPRFRNRLTDPPLGSGILPSTRSVGSKIAPWHAGGYPLGRSDSQRLQWVDQSKGAELAHLAHLHTSGVHTPADLKVLPIFHWST